MTRHQTRGMVRRDRVESRYLFDGRHRQGVVLRVVRDTPGVPRSRAVFVRWDDEHEQLVLTSDLRRLK